MGQPLLFCDDTASNIIQVGLCDVRGALHTGITYSNEAGNTWLIHFWGHRDLKNEDFTRKYVEKYLRVALNPDEVPNAQARQVAGILRLIYQQNQAGFPYALYCDEDVFFDDGGKLHLKPHGKGLTCATFVLCALKCGGVNLVQMSTWRARTEDIPAHQKLLAELEGVDDEHARAIRSEIGCIRFRPEEVAAAAHASIYPVEFHAAARDGAWVAACLYFFKKHKRRPNLFERMIYFFTGSF